jgi:hypothetical protein
VSLALTRLSEKSRHYVYDKAASGLHDRPTHQVSNFSKELAMADTKGRVKDAIDNAADKAKNAAGKAVDKTKEVTKDVGKGVKKAGESIKDAGKKI